MHLSKEQFIRSMLKTYDWGCAGMTKRTAVKWIKEEWGYLQEGRELGKLK